MRDHTDITLLLDRSGSMGSIKEKTISGVNEFIQGQREAGDNASITLVQFDKPESHAEIDEVYRAKPIKEAPFLTAETYVPRGWTPMRDAVGQTIINTGARLAAMPESERPDKVVFVVVTDGLENASTEFTAARVKEMIEHQENVYQWNFIYLGANQDAVKEAQAVGMAAAMAANFTVNNINLAYAAASSNVLRYRGSGNRMDLNWSEAQRKQMEEEADQPKVTSTSTDSWGQSKTN